GSAAGTFSAGAPATSGIRRRSASTLARTSTQRRPRIRAAPAKIAIRNLSAIRRGRRSAAWLATSAKPLVHRVRPLETLCRPIDRDAVSIRIATLASVLAKHTQGRRADLRSGHFPQHHRGGFLSIRRTQAADAERREHGTPEQLGIFRAQRPDLLFERFFNRS